MPAALALVRAHEYNILSKYDYPAPVADIGCGDGFFSSYLFKNKNQIIDIGVDLNPKQAEKARNSGFYREVLTTNASDINLPDCYFQTIFSNCVFEHIPNLVEVFMEIRRILKPGGQYIFTAHSNYYLDYLFTVKYLRKLGLKPLANVYGNFVNHVFKHFNCLTPEEWENKLNKAGLELTYYEYYLGPSALSAFDRLLPFAVPGYFWYKLLQKYTIMPRGFTQIVFHKYLSNLVEKKEPTGGALLLLAKRKDD